MEKRCLSVVLWRLKASVLLGASALIMLSAAVHPVRAEESLAEEPLQISDELAAAEAAPQVDEDLLGGGVVAPPDDYQIGAGDVLLITVYSHDDLRTKTRVSENGVIQFPLIGSVNVGGLKSTAAAKEIEAKLAAGYIKRPQVQIYVEEFKSKKVIVLGQVSRPGLVELSGPASLLELISKAGGLTKEAGETATIKRRVNGKEELITVDLKKLTESGDSNDNISIQSGDSVSVAKASVCYITGEVKRPGSYPCNRDTTVLKMVSLAGSFTGIASESKIKIDRIVDGKKQVLEKVSLDTPVLPDDVIVVPESLF